MKLLSFIFLTIVMAKGCTQEQQNDIDSAVIEYSAITRGSSQKIKIEKKTVTQSRNMRGSASDSSHSISNADWNAIIAEFKTIKLEALPDLAPPTQKRLYDGAPTANLKVTYQGKTYQTPGFDGGSPPAEIEKLVTKITSLVKPEE